MKSQIVALEAANVEATQLNNSTFSRLVSQLRQVPEWEALEVRWLVEARTPRRVRFQLNATFSSGFADGEDFRLLVRQTFEHVSWVESRAQLPQGLSHACELLKTEELLTFDDSEQLQFVSIDESGNLSLQKSARVFVHALVHGWVAPEDRNLEELVRQLSETGRNLVLSVSVTPTTLRTHEGNLWSTPIIPNRGLPYVVADEEPFRPRVLSMVEEAQRANVQESLEAFEGGVFVGRVLVLSDSRISPLLAGRVACYLTLPAGLPGNAFRGGYTIRNWPTDESREVISAVEHLRFLGDYWSEFQIPGKERLRYLFTLHQASELLAWVPNTALTVPAQRFAPPELQGELKLPAVTLSGSNQFPKKSSRRHRTPQTSKQAR